MAGKIDNRKCIFSYLTAVPKQLSVGSSTLLGNSMREDIKLWCCTTLNVCVCVAKGLTQSRTRSRIISWTIIRALSLISTRNNMNFDERMQWDYVVCKKHIAQNFRLSLFLSSTVKSKQFISFMLYTFKRFWCAACHPCFYTENTDNVTENVESKMLTSSLQNLQNVIFKAIWSVWIW